VFNEPRDRCYNFPSDLYLQPYHFLKALEHYADYP
jgi:hypothetical protein